MKYLLVILSLCSLACMSKAQEQNTFDQWLAQLKAEAAERGVSDEIIAEALDEVKYIERAVQSDRSQAEFKESYQDYIRKRVSEWRIDKGQRYLEEFSESMAPVVRHYGVPARVIAAIIGVETNYGTFDLKHEAFDVLATLAFDARRGKRFRKEIFAALEMLDAGYASKASLRSSWAGALGVPQFMPSTYLEYAVDFDKDGKRDIWSHGPDLWASVANYLDHYGWNDEETWARKVIIPPQKQKHFDEAQENLVEVPSTCTRYQKHLTGWRMLSQWNDEGLRRMNGSILPKVEMAASVIVTDPQNSHGYLVYANFCTLMRYNPSFKYALSVGALADAIK